MTDYTTLTDDELEQEFQAINQERTRRQGLDTVYQEIDAVVQKARRQGVITTPQPGDQWDPAKIYSRGDVVTEQGKSYESPHPYNVWKPGDETNPVHWTLWKLLEEPEEGETGYLLWSGLGVNYAAGDVHEHEGHVYEALQDHRSQPDWAPGVAHSLWKLVTQEPEPEDDEDAPGLPGWDPNTDYTTGETFTYQGTTYRVLQNHTSQPHWTPDAVASLYEPVSEDS